ncbi:DUF1624 domain-containing protein [Massilia cavernae]|uniref:DUF1624 domain-containing protein n=2 Tax=Massilia cavernae TaxID=2320864 RepID=A0A418Y7L8_9BURK|nr:DUF1624 domain-containing protein [Massilia cavernae]
MGKIETAPLAAAKTKTRLLAIDALRGLVMVIMLLDHVRENWFLHLQVTDPMNPLLVDPAMFFTRLTSQICAPVFVLLTGLSAWLYGQSHSKRETSIFLIKRGAFLMVLDVSVCSLAWSTSFPPNVFWLQVIWAIGACMIILAALLHMPRTAQIVAGLIIVGGHNLLDGIHLQAGDAFYTLWTMLHQRDVISLGAGFVAKTTYPILPWIGVILLGYTMGPWFADGNDPSVRQRRLINLGLSMIVGFFLLRFMNVYGDKPWIETGDLIRNVMSFMALTKYPPSLLFLLPSLGVGMILLALLERYDSRLNVRRLAFLGGAPMFYYLLHIYVLRILYNAAMLIWGPNHGKYFGFDWIGWAWVWWVALTFFLYFPTKWFADVKRRRRDIWWLKYL